MRMKTLAYLIGAFFGGAAGCLITFQSGATFAERLQPAGLDLRAVHGHPRRHGERLGRRAGRPPARVRSTTRGCSRPAHVQLGDRRRHRHLGVLLPHLRRRDRDVHALPAGGPAAERAPAATSCTRKRSSRSSSRRGPHEYPGPAAGRPRRAQGVRRARGLPGHRLRGAARLDHEPDRAERRRQDDVLQHADGRLHADRRRDPVRRPRARRAAAAPDHGARASGAHSRTSASSAP